MYRIMYFKFQKNIFSNNYINYDNKVVGYSEKDIFDI